MDTLDSDPFHLPFRTTKNARAVRVSSSGSSHWHSSFHSYAFPHSHSSSGFSSSSTVLIAHFLDFLSLGCKQWTMLALDSTLHTSLCFALRSYIIRTYSYHATLFLFDSFSCFTIPVLLSTPLPFTLRPMSHAVSIFLSHPHAIPACVIILSQKGSQGLKSTSFQQIIRSRASFSVRSDR
jgi:hypothetical protein